MRGPAAWEHIFGQRGNTAFELRVVSTNQEIGCGPLHADDVICVKTHMDSLYSLFSSLYKGVVIFPGCQTPQLWGLV